MRVVRVARMLCPVAVMSEEKRHARSQKFSIPDQMWGIQAKEQGLEAGDIFCRDPDRADPEPMVRQAEAAITRHPADAGQLLPLRLH